MTKFHKYVCKMFHVKHYPPGMDMEAEKWFFGLGMCGAFFYSWTFIWRYLQARSELYRFAGLFTRPSELVPNGTIETFLSLLGNALIGFEFVAIGMIGFAIMHYRYFWQGSKTIYLMKRLPNKMELIKRVWTVPFIAIGACIVAALVLLALYYGLYLIATPKQCLPADVGLF